MGRARVESGGWEAGAGLVLVVGGWWLVVVVGYRLFGIGYLLFRWLLVVGRGARALFSSNCRTLGVSKDAARNKQGTLKDAPIRPSRMPSGRFGERASVGAPLWRVLR
jgi:hypothetical protein